MKATYQQTVVLCLGKIYLNDDNLDRTFRTTPYHCLLLGTIA